MRVPADPQGAPESTTGQMVTELLCSAERGTHSVIDRLMPLLYDELHEMAHGYLVRERPGHTLSTTALVHEAYLKLVDDTEVSSRGRAYFFGAAARAMRRVLVDYARRHRRLKRGGRRQRVPLDERDLSIDEFAAELLDLNAALDRLSEHYPRQARVMECRFFGGLTVDTTADVLDVSTRTIKRDAALARAWLYRELEMNG